MAVGVTGLLPTLPLLPYLVIQAFSILSVRANDSLCTTRLMHENAGRIAAFHGHMGLLAGLTPAGGGLVDAAGLAREAAGCSAFLTFLSFLMGIVLPMLLMARTAMYAVLGGWAADLQTSQSSGAEVARQMCGTSRRAGRPWMYWWAFLHLAWSLSALTV
jgi:hypothetical protein